jgi:hypothetical protein
MIKRISEDKATIWLAAFALAMLMARLLSSAYTSGDDGYTYMAASAEQGWINSTWEMVVFQGRFYQLFVYPLAMLPFQFDNILIANVFKVFTFLVFLSGFAYLVRQFLSKTQTAGCIALFICVFETVGGSYNAFHGLPLWFGLVCGMLLFSLAFHYRHVALGDQGARKWAIFCFVWALLGYEVILLYTPLFVFLSIYAKASNGGGRPLFSVENSKLLVLEHLWLIVISALYLVTYFIFRIYYPGTYVGAQGLTIGTLEATIWPIWQFSVNSINLFGGIEGASSFSITSLFFAIATALAVALSFRQSVSNTRTSDLKLTLPIIFLLVIVAIYIFIPNLLFGFTQRYRSWAAYGVPIYLGSLYSSVCLSILLYLALRSLASLFSAISRQAVLTLFIVFSALLVSGYQNSKSSENFYRQSNMMSVRWDVASWVTDELNNSELSSSYPVSLCSRGFIFNKDLKIYFRNPDLIADAKIYWDRYFTGHTNLSVSVVDIQGASTGDIEKCSAIVELSYFDNSAVFELNQRRETKALDKLKSIPNLVDFPNALLGL